MGCVWTETVSVTKKLVGPSSPPPPPPLEGETMAREHRVVTTQKACIRLDKKCHVNRKLDVMSKGLNSENNVCISSANGFRG